MGVRLKKIDTERGFRRSVKTYSQGKRVTTRGQTSYRTQPAMDLQFSPPSTFSPVRTATQQRPRPGAYTHPPASDALTHTTNTDARQHPQSTTQSRNASPSMTAAVPAKAPLTGIRFTRPSAGMIWARPPTPHQQMQPQHLRQQWRV